MCFPSFCCFFDVGNDDVNCTFVLYTGLPVKIWPMQDPDSSDVVLRQEFARFGQMLDPTNSKGKYAVGGWRKQWPNYLRFGG